MLGAKSLAAANRQKQFYEAASATTTPLTSNSVDDSSPRINASGGVVWYGHDGTDTEIFLYDPRRSCYTVAQTQPSAYGVAVFDTSLGTLEEVRSSSRAPPPTTGATTTRTCSGSSPISPA